MIAANELRIGNYFLYGKHDYIGKLSTITFDRKEGILINGQIPESHLKPIHLTPDILEKSTHWGKWKDGTWTDGHCEYQYDFETKIFATHSEVDGSGWKLKKIEFVHDFQNLFYALTQTELEIELNK